MKQDKKLIKKINILETFDKITDFKIFNLSSKIVALEKQIGTIDKTFKIINQFRKKVGKESHFFKKFIIDEKETKSRITNKIAYIFLQTNDDSHISKYSDLKIIEYIKKNISKKDLVYIIGQRLFDLIDTKKDFPNLDKNKLIFLNDHHNQKQSQNEFAKYDDIFKQIIDLSLYLYEDMIADKIMIFYSDIKNPSKLLELDILPLNFYKNTNLYNQSSSQQESEKTKNNLEKNIIDVLNYASKNNQTIHFESDLYLVNRIILKTLISFSIKYIIFIYFLNMMLREMYVLKDNKKSIEKNINKINQLINKHRQEYITREMIATASTLKNMKKNKEGDEYE